MRKTPARPHPAHWGRGRPESRKRERADHPLRPRGREGFPALRKNGDAGTERPMSRENVTGGSGYRIPAATTTVLEDSRSS
jgi:hypothetical protein